MRGTRAGCLSFALLAVGSVAAQPQTQPAPAQPPLPGPVIRAGTSEVLVDVVVRNKKGRLVRDLTRDDFTVLEDGVEHEITSWRELQGPDRARAQADTQPATPAAGPPAQAIRVSRQVRLASMVFERLSQEGRQLARQGALNFLENDHGSEVYYAVFHIDRNLRVIQPYTNNRALLKTAIEIATGITPSNFASDKAALERLANATSGSEGAAAALSTASQGGQQGPGPVEGAALSNEQAQAMVSNMGGFAAALSREDLGRVSVFSIWAIVQGLAHMPGRKNVLYFAEGLQMPNSLWLQFQSMISAANRANVSVYAIDARGVTVASDQAAADASLRTAAAQSWTARTTENTGEDTFRGFDIALDSLRANAQMVMRELAESTGGFLIANTNDLRPSLARLSEEFNSYYELTYRPRNSAYDGRFRAITVRVNQPDVLVQARNGYFALPPMDGQTVFPYEVPLLHALGSTPLPRELDFHAAVIPFQFANGRQQSSLVMDLPLEGIAFSRDERAKAYRTHISLLSLVKDSQGMVVAKLSRDLPLQEPLDKLEAYRKGRFIVTRPVMLAPGRYTLESVVADFEGNRFAARRSVLTVGEPRPGPGLSGLSLLRRLDKPPEYPDPEDPLHLSDARVVPTLIDTLPGGKGSMLSVFFTVYPEAGSVRKPQLYLDLLRDGALLARHQPELPAPRPNGTVPYFANVPLETLSAGHYEFRVTVLDGQAGAQQTLAFTLE